MLPIIPKSKIWYTLSGFCFIASIMALVIWRLNFGIDFTGGSLLTIEFTTQRPMAPQLMDSLKPLELGEIILQTSGEDAFNVRFKEIGEEKHQEILATLRNDFSGVQERRFESIGGV